MTNDLERAVDTVLSGLATTPEQRQRVNGHSALHMAHPPAAAHIAAHIQRDAAQPGLVILDGGLLIPGHGPPGFDKGFLQCVLRQNAILQLDKAKTQQCIGIPVNPVRHPAFPV